MSQNLQSNSLIQMISEPSSYQNELSVENSNADEEFFFQESGPLTDQSHYQALMQSAKNCVFCPKLNNKMNSCLMINRALFLKFSSSQNYYYTKEIAEFLENSRKKYIISFKDQICYEENEDYLTEFFKKKSMMKKLRFLVEYYKYHKEIPRIFMHPLNIVMNRFNDRKR